MKNYVLKPAGGAPLRIDYEKELNPQQLDVVLAGDGPILVIAGAGSGKTRTLTYRVARLVECGVPPQQILLLTFTNKAAREMLRRVESLLRLGPEQRITGGTFHHVGNLVLRRHAGLVGLKPNFTILDRDDAADLMSDVVASLGGRKDRADLPKADVLVEIASLLVNLSVTLKPFLEERYPHLREAEPLLQRILDGYRRKKLETNSVDFDDLLAFWHRILARHDDVRAEQGARFRYLLVDEYQDTNRLQAEIVEAIAGPEGNLMVVGDDAQSIYSWRGAHFANIIDFPKRFPSARMFKLEVNYRSTPQVLALANSSIGHNGRQFRKTLRAHRPGGALPEAVCCGSPDEQARYVAQRIGELMDEGYAFGDIAVLYRAHWHSMELQMQLTDRKIPFVVRSGLRFFEQAHIKDVCAFIRLVVNPRDEMGWKRALKLTPGIGETTAGRVWEAVAADPEPLNAILRDSVFSILSKRAHAGWRRFTKLVFEIEKLQASPAEMIRRIVDLGYRAHLEAAYTDYQNRLDDLDRLADFAMRYPHAREMLDELALTITVAGRDAVEASPDTDVVVLSTVHQAKGLEWRAVFVLWLVDGKFPDTRSVTEAYGDSGGEEEERRLFYVACTRAKDLLTLVHPVLASERRMMGVIQQPSRFLSELDKGTYEEVRVGIDLDPRPRRGYRVERDWGEESEDGSQESE